MLISPAKKISGTIRLPGDKSISHRIVLLSLLNRGTISIRNLSDCMDVQTSLDIIRSLEVGISERHKTTILASHNPLSFTGELKELYCGNSGTTARLLSGILCRCHGRFKLTGDASLSQRPMRRIIEPLTAMGADIFSDNSDRLPLLINGKHHLTPIRFNNSLSSAQVKSAILFAATAAEGLTTVIENIPSRDHTERLFKKVRMPLKSAALKDAADHTNSPDSNTASGSAEISLAGPFNLQGDFDFIVPGDISSAAFYATAAAIIPGSHLKIENVLLNPGRIGFLKVLQRMGAKISISVLQNDWEPSGNIEIRGGNLQATAISAEQIPFLIDELPVLAAAMAFAEGESTVTGATELRNKEADRISSLIRMLKTAGVNCEELPDGYIIHGPATIKNTTELNPDHDHRLAMTAAVIGLKSCDGIIIKQPACVSISFPDFFEMLKQICRN